MQTLLGLYAMKRWRASKRGWRSGVREGIPGEPRWLQFEPRPKYPGDPQPLLARGAGGIAPMGVVQCHRIRFGALARVRLGSIHFDPLAGAQCSADGVDVVQAEREKSGEKPE